MKANYKYILRASNWLQMREVQEYSKRVKITTNKESERVTIWIRELRERKRKRYNLTRGLS